MDILITVIVAIGFMVSIMAGLYVIYHVVRGFVLAVDYTYWRLKVVNHHKFSIKLIPSYIKATLGMVPELIGYRAEWSSYECGGYVWEGLGTGRRPRG